jgi:hypothetical protein
MALSLIQNMTAGVLDQNIFLFNYRSHTSYFEAFLDDFLTSRYRQDTTQKHNHNVRNYNYVRLDLPIAAQAVNGVKFIISVAEFRKQPMTPI